jgi:predicted Fe-Mo cluster-binding NifX family protein
MLAIPIDTKESTIISKLYGRVPYFAILNTQTGDYNVISNDVQGEGPKSGDFLQTKGVTSTIFYYMGEGVYKSFTKNGMDVYTADYNEYTIKEIFSNLKNNKLTKLTNQNYKQLLNPGEGETCSCGCEDSK